MVVPGSCLAYLPPTFEVVEIILGALRLVLHSDGYGSNCAGSVNASLAEKDAVGLDNIGYAASAKFFTLLPQIICHQIGRRTTTPAISSMKGRAVSL